MFLKRLLHALFVMGIVAFHLNAQTVENADSLGRAKRSFMQKVLDYLDESNEEKPDKKLDISFLGGPYYASDTQLGIGIVASGLYRLDRNDKSLSPSNLSLYGNLTTTGFYGLGIRSNTIFPQNKYKIDADLGFFSYPTRFYGVGYEQGKQKKYSEYTLWEFYVNGNFQKRIVKNVYMGLVAEVYASRGKEFDEPAFLHGEGKHHTSVGIGGIVSYDSRDFIPNPSKGIYAKLQYVNYPIGLGSTRSFRKTEGVFRYYRTVWEGGILAFDAQGIFNAGDVPWSMMALLGNSFQMRGYYKGRYRDKKLLQGQVELRQHIAGRHGAVAWAGAGNVFSHMDDFKGSHTLPNFGIGYRWEFKKRVNVRLDYGFGKGQSAFYFNINEAF